MVNGKKVYLKDLEKSAEAEGEDEEVIPENDDKKDDDDGDNKPDANDSEIEEAANEAAKSVMKKIGVDKILAMDKKLKGVEKDSRMKDVLEGSFSSKDIEGMTKEQKILGFFNAVVTKDRTKLEAFNASNKVQTEGTAADGGYFFPDEFRAELIKDIENNDHLRTMVKVISMRRDIMKMPNLQDRPKLTWTGEAATKATTTFHLDELTLTARKMAAIIYISDELIEDASQYFDVTKEVISMFAEQIAEEEDRVIVAGNGTTQPTGLTVAGTIGSRTCSGNLSFDNLIDLIYDLPNKYHRKARFLVNRANIKELRKMKDGNNQFLWQPPVQQGEPALLHGFPIQESSYMPEATIHFGDFKKGYYLGDRHQMRVKLSQETETAFTKDLTAVRVVERIAGTVILPEAIKELATIP